MWVLYQNTGFHHGQSICESLYWMCVCVCVCVCTRVPKMACVYILGLSTSAACLKTASPPCLFTKEEREAKLEPCCTLSSIWISIKHQPKLQGTDSREADT